jgi:hypothetical protein
MIRARRIQRRPCKPRKVAIDSVKRGGKRVELARLRDVDVIELIADLVACLDTDDAEAVIERLARLTHYRWVRSAGKDLRREVDRNDPDARERAADAFIGDTVNSALSYDRDSLLVLLASDAWRAAEDTDSALDVSALVLRLASAALRVDLEGEATK